MGYNHPLHHALLSCNVVQLQTLANRHTMDMENLMNTMYVLSEHSRQGRHITPLQAAIITGNYRTCKRLILEGASFFSLCYDMYHPLNMALDSGKYQIAKLLINSGADVFTSQQGFLPMYFAIKADTPEYIVEMIINKGFPAHGVIETIYNSTSLHRSVACNNVPLVSLFLSHGPDCNVVDGHEGLTPIHIAVKHRLPTLVKLLAEHNANLEIECREGFTPIFYAVGNNDVECLDILLRSGAKINHLSSIGYVYPLNFAVSLCCVEATELLLKRGADVELTIPITGDLPIHSAAMSQQNKISMEYAEGLKTIVEQLLEKGSKIDSVNKMDRTPLQVAIVEENFQIAELLIQAGAAVNRPLDHGTSLHLVAKRGNKEIVTEFLEHGADYSFFDVNKITPYHNAALNPDLTVLPVFWRFHCPFDLPLLGENSRKPLFPAAAIDLLNYQKKFLTGVKSNDVNSMRDALAGGADARGCSMKLSHPLHFAAESGFTSVVELLLEKGVAPSSVDGEYETPLHLSAKAGHYEVCRSLLKHGAVYNSRSKTKKTPLDLAIENGHEEVISLLKEVDMMFKSCKEKKVCRKLKETSSIANDDLYLVYINAMNRKGQTLMRVAMKKCFDRLTVRIVLLRATSKDV